MRFIKINYYKLIIYFVINLLTATILSSRLFFKIKNQPLQADVEDAVFLIALIYLIAIMYYILTTCIAIVYFNQNSKRIATGTIAFKENEFTYDLIYKKNIFMYTRQCVIGKINDFPVVLTITEPIDKYMTTTLEFYFFITKFNNTNYECFTFPVKKLSDNKEKLLHELEVFSMSLKNKGNIPGNLNGTPQSFVNILEKWH